MGNSEEEKPSKAEVLSSSPMDHNNVPVYPDWAAMQAYYGARLAAPPYHNSVASSHVPPPYMWGPPQSMIPPYGAPYAAFYAPGGVYAHPGVHLAPTPLSIDTPVKSSGNTDGGFVKKLKEFDGLAISIGNGNDESVEDAADHGVTQSEETEETSDASDGAGQSGAKRRHRKSPKSGNIKDKKHSKGILFYADKPAKPEETRNTTSELKDPSDFNVKSSPINPQQQALKPSETWIQNERELKRERRKQSNRESARRSRLRKQAEHEELAIKVQDLTCENTSLKSEINKFMSNSKKLKLENATLLEKLKDAQLGRGDETTLHEDDDFRQKTDGTVNLLARVNNNHGSIDRKNDESETLENTSAGEKLRQLLDNSTRTDAVAAS